MPWVEVERDGVAVELGRAVGRVGRGAERELGKLEKELKEDKTRKY